MKTCILLLAGIARMAALCSHTGPSLARGGGLVPLLALCVHCAFAHSYLFFSVLATILSTQWPKGVLSATLCYGPGAGVGTVSMDALSSSGDGGSLPYGLPIPSLNVCTRRGAALLWVSGF